jgi:hypothetical protein
MMHIHLKRFIPFIVLISILVTQACTDEWDEHYDVVSFDLPDKTLTAYIQENPDLTVFSEMLEISGFDIILDASQTYTVWVPVNDALNGVDATDTKWVQEIVQNHIARSRITSSGIENQSIRMLNGKYITFARKASGYSFGNTNVIELNLPTSNGLVHVIDGYAPFLKNLWEYIDRTENLDSLRSYLYGQSKEVFDPVNSREIGVNATGQPIYDTVFIFSNPVLERLGALDSEDSIYTAIMPDNTAWTEAYGRIESFFNFPEDAGGVQRQREQTQWILVYDMLFRGRITQPEAMDSLVSTTGSVFYDPGYLFLNAEPETLSNGITYVTDQMPYTDTVSWFKEIRVEAENTAGRDHASSIIFPRSSYGSGLDVSNNQYILVDPTSTQPTVEFSIPNTLSATYNIYCVFVPALIVDPTDTITTKVSFKLTYIRRSTGSTFIKRITPDNNATDPDGMTKMFVEQFDFEYANVIDMDYLRMAVKLEVINEVTIEEELAGDFTRTMRIDCVILEPVTE